jgi:hypothetical protein
MVTLSPKQLAAGLYIVALFLLALSTFGCTSTRSGTTAGNSQPPLSKVSMNDLSAGSQLLTGFYGVENNSWRWTAGRFSVQLGSPPGASQNGAKLNLSFTVPDALIRNQKSVSLSASIGGMQLKSQSYNTSGPLVFTADIPGSMLPADSVRIDFALDKTTRPEGDRRELGVIAGSVELDPSK